MTKKVALNPDWPRAANAGFAMGMQVGDTVYVSGQVALDGDGNIVGVGDMSAQARQVFDNIEAVLAEAGATMADIVKITTYVTDMARYAEYNAVRAAVFPDARIASATVTSPRLVKPEYLVEVEATAVIGSGP